MTPLSLPQLSFTVESSNLSLPPSVSVPGPIDEEHQPLQGDGDVLAREEDQAQQAANERDEESELNVREGEGLVLDTGATQGHQLNLRHQKYIIPQRSSSQNEYKY